MVLLLVPSCAVTLDADTVVAFEWYAADTKVGVLTAYAHWVHVGMDSARTNSLGVATHAHWLLNTCCHSHRALTIRLLLTVSRLTVLLRLTILLRLTEFRGAFHDEETPTATV